MLHVNGPLLVLAGAGSGKTRVLTTRIARLIDIEGVDPRNILAVTFTNKAAGEMRERIGRMLGAEPAGMWVGTFHAIGARMLRSAAHLVGRTPSFTIYDQDDSLGVIKRLMERHNMSHKAVHAARRAVGAISDAKNALVTPTEYERLAMDPFSKAIAPVYPLARRSAADGERRGLRRSARAAGSDAAAASRQARELSPALSDTSSSTSTRTRIARSTS